SKKAKRVISGLLAAPNPAITRVSIPRKLRTGSQARLLLFPAYRKFFLREIGLRFLSPSTADCLPKPPVARIFAPVSPRTQASRGKSHTKIFPGNDETAR